MKKKLGTVFALGALACGYVILLDGTARVSGNVVLSVNDTREQHQVIQEQKNIDYDITLFAQKADEYAKRASQTDDENKRKLYLTREARYREAIQKLSSS